MFGQTVTVSGDTMRQYANHRHAHPRKWTCMDIECEAGCGVVPFRYRDQNFVNALQWAIGLELFLLVDDPWRVFLTTDHPNGAPFTSYPQLIRLLMDRSFRNDQLARIHPEAAALSCLGSLDREYSLYEIAIMTRAAPARILGLDRPRTPGPRRPRRHHRLSPAGRSGTDLRPSPAGLQGGRGGRGRRVPWCAWCGAAPRWCGPRSTPPSRHRIGRWFDRYHSIRMANFRITETEMADGIGSPVTVHPCRPGAGYRMIRNGIEIEDTFAEAFGMKAARLIITAIDPALGTDRR